MANIKENIINIIAKMAHQNPSNITGKSRLTQDLGLKSANRIGLSALLEEQYRIELTLFDIMSVKTIDDVSSLIQSKLM
ncbi:MAG: acyl carrier protein [Bacillus sp. (in: firmicutes)]